MVGFVAVPFFASRFLVCCIKLDNTFFGDYVALGFWLVLKFGAQAGVR